MTLAAVTLPRGVSTVQPSPSVGLARRMEWAGVLVCRFSPFSSASFSTPVEKAYALRLPAAYWNDPSAPGVRKRRAVSAASQISYRAAGSSSPMASLILAMASTPSSSSARE